MATLTRWEPFRDVRRMHDLMDRLMDDALFSPTRVDGGWFEGIAPVDLYQTDDDVVVKATLPGVNPDDIHISVTGDMLTLRGEVREVKETENGDGRQYHIRENRFSQFSRSLTLPTLVNAEKGEADYENGVLTLTFPKAEEVKPKTITVRAK